MDHEGNIDRRDFASHHITLRESDEIAKQPRFSIMFLLYIHKKIGFTELQRLLELTPGNLDHHLRKLERLGYISIRKVISWRPLTIIEINSEGTSVFETYIFTLRKLLEAIE